MLFHVATSKNPRQRMMNLSGDIVLDTVTGKMIRKNNPSRSQDNFLALKMAAAGLGRNCGADR